MIDNKGGDKNDKQKDKEYHEKFSLEPTENEKEEIKESQKKAEKKRKKEKEEKLKESDFAFDLEPVKEDTVLIEVPKSLALEIEKTKGNELTERYPVPDEDGYKEEISYSLSKDTSVVLNHAGSQFILRPNPDSYLWKERKQPVFNKDRKTFLKVNNDGGFVFEIWAYETDDKAFYIGIRNKLENNQRLYFKFDIFGLRKLMSGIMKIAHWIGLMKR